MGREARLRAAQATATEITPDKPRQVLSACLFRAEVTTYNPEGEVMLRPKLVDFGFLEAHIPAPVREWILGRALWAAAQPPPSEPDKGTKD